MVERGTVICSKVSCPSEHNTITAQKCCNAQNLGSLTNPYPKENTHTDWLNHVSIKQSRDFHHMIVGVGTGIEIEYTMLGIGLRFLNFFLSTLEQRTNFLKLNA